MSSIAQLATISDTANGTSGAKTYGPTSSGTPATGDQLVARISISSAAAIADSNVSMSDSSSDGIVWKLKDSAVGTNSSSLWIWTGVFVADRACTNASRTFSVAVTGLSGSNPSGCLATFDAVTGPKAYGDNCVRGTGHDSGNTNVHPSPNLPAAALTTSVVLAAASDNWATQHDNAPTGLTDQTFQNHSNPAHGFDPCYVLSGFTGSTLAFTGIGPGAFPWSAVSIEIDCNVTTATSAKTLDNVTSSAAGAVALRATESVTLGAATSSAAGAVAIQASEAVTLADVTSVAIGTIAGSIQGTAANTLADVISATAGAIAIQAAAADTLADVTSAAAGAAAIHGAAADTLGDATSAATGAVAIQAAAANMLADVTSAAIGAIAIHGAAADTLGDATSAATGAVAIQAAAADTLGDAASTAAGAVAIHGTSADILADATSAATGADAIQAVAADTLGDVTSTATGAFAIKGISSSTLDDVTQVATSSETVASDPIILLVPPAISRLRCLPVPSRFFVPSVPSGLWAGSVPSILAIDEVNAIAIGSK